MGATVTDPYRLQIERGRKSFERGDPWPPDGDTDKSVLAFWVGYHGARLRAFWERRRVMQLLGVTHHDR